MEVGIDGLSVDDLSVYYVSVDYVSVDDVSVDDLSIDDLSVDLPEGLKGFTHRVSTDPRVSRVVVFIEFRIVGRPKMWTPQWVTPLSLTAEVLFSG